MTRLGCVGLCLVLAVGLPANMVDEVPADSGDETFSVAIIDCPPLFPDWLCP